MPSCKSAGMQTLEAYILHFLRGVSQALQWHLLKPFKAQRFKRACMARKTLSEVCGKLTQHHGKDTIVGFAEPGELSAPQGSSRALRAPAVHEVQCGDGA